MAEMLFGVEPFYVLVYLIAGTAGGLGIGWKIIKMLTKVDNRGKNHNKAFVILSEHLDSETDRLHPERSPNHISDTIRTVLKEDDVIL